MSARKINSLPGFTGQNQSSLLSDFNYVNFRGRSPAQIPSKKMYTSLISFGSNFTVYSDSVFAFVQVIIFKNLSDWKKKISGGFIGKTSHSCFSSFLLYYLSLHLQFTTSTRHAIFCNISQPAVLTLYLIPSKYTVYKVFVLLNTSLLFILYVITFNFA